MNRSWLRKFLGLTLGLTLTGSAGLLAGSAWCCPPGPALGPVATAACSSADKAPAGRRLGSQMTCCCDQDAARLAPTDVAGPSSSVRLVWLPVPAQDDPVLARQAALPAFRAAGPPAPRSFKPSSRAPPVFPA